MSKNAAKDAVRVAKRDARLGENAVCVFCGYANADALVPVKRSIVEKHHVVGRAHEAAITVPVCRNCHAVLTEAVRRSGASMKEAPNLLERLVTMLEAVGTFFKMMGQAFLWWAEQLARFILGLDQRYPDWRKELKP